MQTKHIQNTFEKRNLFSRKKLKQNTATKEAGGPQQHTLHNIPPTETPTSPCLGPEGVPKRPIPIQHATLRWLRASADRDGRLPLNGAERRRGPV